MQSQRKGSEATGPLRSHQCFSKRYVSSLFFTWSTKGTGKLEEAACGGLHGTSCQHPQVTTTNLMHKHWDWQEDRTPMLRHGSVVRTTMYLASMDIKTAFDEARPRHVAKIMENHATHGWLISALFR